MAPAEASDIDRPKWPGAPDVVQVTREIGPAAGVERVAFELARAFDRKGVVNRVLASEAAGLDGLNTIVEPVASWLGRIPTRGALRHLGRLITVPVFTLASTWALRRHRRAVIISHGDCLSADVLVVHAVNAESLRLKRAAGKWRWLLNPLHLWVQLRDAVVIDGLRPQMFVAVSKRTAAELETHHHVPPGRIAVIPNGVDLARFKPDETARTAIRRELSIPGDARVILFAGHEFGRKGLAFLLEALDRLGEDVWVVVVGSDSPAAYRSISKVAQHRVVFAGARTDMPALFAAADLFVFPTLYETFSLVCMEALASGLPILASRTGGIEDYLEPGSNGFFIERDATDIAAKVELLFGDPDLMKRCQQGALKTARRYDWSSVADTYLDLIARLPSRPVRRHPQRGSSMAGGRRKSVETNRPRAARPLGDLQGR